MENQNTKITLPEFINSFGADRLAKCLAVTRQTVWQWQQLNATPKPETTAIIIALSNNLLTWESINHGYLRKKFGKKTIKIKVPAPNDLTKSVTTIEVSF